MVLAQGRMPDAMEDSEVRMMKCMESYGIMEDKDVCKAVLDCLVGGKRMETCEGMKL